MRNYVSAKRRPSPSCQLNAATRVSPVDQQKNCPVNAQNKNIIVGLSLLIIRVVYCIGIDN